MRNQIYLIFLLSGLYSAPAFAQQKFDPSACEPTTDKEILKEYKKAEKLSGKEKIAALNKVMAADNNCHEALFDLAMAYIQTKSPEKARYCFEELMKLCENYSPYTWFHLGNIYMASEEYDKAAKMYEKCMAYQNETVNLGDEDYKAAKAGLEQAKKSVQILGNAVPYDPKAVTGVCTSMDEYLGIISPDNQLMYFTRKYPDSRSDIGFKEVFMVSENKGNFMFDAGKALPLPFNSGFNVGAAALTATNDEMYLVICDENRPENCDIFHSRREIDGWTQPQRCPTPLNAPGFWDSHPTVSYDGSQMVFASNRPGSAKDPNTGRESMDLFYSEKKSDGTWSTPVALGPEINTSNNEGHPFLHSDSRTLYFSSRGHNSIGGYDFYMSRQNPDGSWSKAKNLGSPINTKEDERGLFVSLDGAMAFFFGKGVQGGVGGLDQYQFPLYEAVRPDKIKMVKGEIRNDESVPEVPATVEVKNLRTNEIKTVSVDKETGKYVAVVNTEDDHLITVKQPGVAFVSQLIEKEVQEPLVMGKDLDVKTIEVGQAYRINDINFATNSSALTTKAARIIEEFASFLKTNPQLRIAIHGHTDNVGDDAANQQLSAQRARAVYDFLVSKGIAADRLEHKGFGETKPVADNATETGRARNRRTEFVILQK